MLKNINTALESDIEAIGITQQIAKYIIDSRNYFNGFANIADLDKLDLTSEEKSLLIQNFLFEPISSVQIKINDQIITDQILLIYNQNGTLVAQKKAINGLVDFSNLSDNLYFVKDEINTNQSAVIIKM